MVYKTNSMITDVVIILRLSGSSFSAFYTYTISYVMPIQSGTWKTRLLTTVSKQGATLLFPVSFLSYDCDQNG